MSDTLVPEALVDAYRQTCFKVFAEPESFSLRIDRQSPELAALLAQNGAEYAAFITAENPASIPTSVDENARRQLALRAELEAIGALVIPGEGQGTDPAWAPEASWLAIGITRVQACALGAAHGQNAIVCIGADAVPELVLLR